VRVIDSNRGPCLLRRLLRCLLPCLSAWRAHDSSVPSGDSELDRELEIESKSERDAEKLP